MGRPLVVTLCGSSRFPDAFALANMHLTMRGCVVISLSCFGHADYPTGAKFLTSDGDESTPEKKHLDTIHFRKIDISDVIYVVNPGGYIGSSTKREIEYARSQGKSVEWMFPDAALSTAPAARTGDEVDGWLPIEQLPPRTKALFGRWEMYGTAGQSDEQWGWQEAAGTYHDYEGERFWNLDGRSFAGAPFYGKAPTHAWALPAAPAECPAIAAAPAADGGRA